MSAPREQGGGAERRTGDTVAIPGSYQHDARNAGNAVQRFWHATKTRTIERMLPPAPGDEVVDVGCGSGVVSAWLAGRGAEVLGVDGNEDAIAFARATWDVPGLRFQRGLVDEDFAPRRPLDKVYCLELIEHVHEDQGLAMLRLFRRHLAPAGRVFLTTPNYRSAWPAIELLMDALRLAPQLADHQHVTRYHPRRLRSLCERAGFRVERMGTTSFLAPWLAPLSWRLAQRVDDWESGRRFPPGSILACVLAPAEGGDG